MQPWKKKKPLLRGATFQTVLEPMEREVLGNLTSTVSEAIIARAQSAPKDELAEMLDMPTGNKEAPEDPSLRRLFPAFFAEGEEEFDGDASLMRSLHENDIAKEKLRAIQVINDALGPDGGVAVSIDENAAHAFLSGLNDLRLYLSSGEVINEEDEQNRDVLVEWLGYCQESLLEALTN